MRPWDSAGDRRTRIARAKYRCGLRTDIGRFRKCEKERMDDALHQPGPPLRSLADSGGTVDDAAGLFNQMQDLSSFTRTWLRDSR